MRPSLYIRDIRQNFNRLEEYKYIFLKKFLNYHQVSGSELKILTKMPREKACLVRDLALSAKYDSGNTSRIVKSLEEKGLVICSVPHFDKRSKQVRLSGQGRDLVRKLDEAVLQQLGSFVINYPSDKLEGLIETLSDLNFYLAEEHQIDKMNRKLRKKARPLHLDS